jgi:hypothetical protein
LNGKLEKSCIIEVKYRKYANLYKDNITATTKVASKLSDYNNKIEYISPNHNQPIHPVDKIIFAYPEDPFKSEIVWERNFGRFIFLQLSPGKEKEGQYGYEKFKEELRKVINNPDLPEPKEVVF